MPTVIKPGVIPTPKLLWYLAATWTCGHCGCEFRMDADDTINIQDSYSSGGQRATTKCPTCDIGVTAFEPNKTFERVVEGNPWLSPQPLKRYLGDL